MRLSRIAITTFAAIRIIAALLLMRCEHVVGLYYRSECNGPCASCRAHPAIRGEVDTWNRSGISQIHCVIFYRYPRYDSFFIEGREDVIAEYQGAVARGYESPG